MALAGSEAMERSPIPCCEGLPREELPRKETSASGVMATHEFEVRRAGAAGHRGCTTCKRPIAEGELCITHNSKSRASVRWRHLSCANLPKAFATSTSDASLPGFAALDASARAEVRAWLEAQCGSSALVDSSDADAPMLQAANTAPTLGASSSGEGGTLDNAAPLAPSDRKARKPLRKRYHIEHVTVRSWHAFSIDSTSKPQNSTVRVDHARSLLTRLQHEIYAQRPAEAMRLLALLLRTFTHLRTPLAQAGIQLLSQRPSDAPKLVRWANRMSKLDRPHRSTWLLSAAFERLRAVGATAAVAMGSSGVDGADERAAAGDLARCYQDTITSLLGPGELMKVYNPNDGDLHGTIGLLQHAQLHLVSVLTTVWPSDAAQPLPFAIDPSVWRRAPLSLIPATKLRENLLFIKSLRKEQRSQQHALAPHSESQPKRRRHNTTADAPTDPPEGGVGGSTADEEAVVNSAREDAASVGSISAGHATEDSVDDDEANDDDVYQDDDDDDDDDDVDQDAEEGVEDEDNVSTSSSPDEASTVGDLLGATVAEQNVDDQDEHFADLVALRDPAKALDRARDAYRHVSLGLKYRPDSNLYQLCAAQVLVLIGHLIEITSSRVEGGGSAVLSDSDSDEDATGQAKREAGTPAEMCTRAAEVMLHKAAHVETTASPDKELWLQWLQRYAPTNLGARAHATLSVLLADGTSECGFEELMRLVRALHGAIPIAEAEAEAEATASEVEAGRALRRAASVESVDTARRALPFGTVLKMVAARIELRPRDMIGWRALHLVLSCAEASMNANGEQDTAPLETLLWWQGVADWWPEACLEVERTLSATAGLQASLRQLRQACACLLLLLCSKITSPVARTITLEQLRRVATLG